MWWVNNRGEKTFSGGKNAWALAAEAAGRCPDYSGDSENEQVADERLSCYNCRYRRWTADTFICLKVV